MVEYPMTIREMRDIAAELADGERHPADVILDHIENKQTGLFRKARAVVAAGLNTTARTIQPK